MSGETTMTAIQRITGVALTLGASLHSVCAAGPDPYNPEYVAGVLLVKLTDAAPIAKPVTVQKGLAVTGIAALDALHEEHGVEKMELLFPQAGTPARKPVPRTMRDHRGNEYEVPSLERIYQLHYSGTIDPVELADEYGESEYVEYAEPDYLFYAAGLESGGALARPGSASAKGMAIARVRPNDPLHGDQWYLDQIRAPEAWELTTGDSTQVIAIIDTGVDWVHPDLDDNIWVNGDEVADNGSDDDANGYVDDVRGWDFINHDNDPRDDNGHGTHVAGIAAAEGDNDLGICGVAWNARIMPVKMLQSSGTGASSDLAEAIMYAASNGATVINMSLSSYAESITVRTALENAYAYAVLVAAAGNDGYKIDPPFPPFPPYFPAYPACYSYVIGVQAAQMDRNARTGWQASFSNFDPSGPVVAANEYGHNYELMAPGVSMHSTFRHGNYRPLQGTSMAAPVVAGAVALIKPYQSQSTEELFARLIQGANEGVLDVRNSLDYQLTADIHYVTHTLLDTLPGCDEDGIADAGETIELYFTVKNAGGYADSVWSKLRFGEFEDISVAGIVDSTSYVGDISAYATLTGGADPIRVQIAPEVANSRDITFEYEIGAKNQASLLGEITITVQNGAELSGVFEGTMRLSPGRLYIVTSNTVVDSLVIEPGTTIRIGQDVALTVSSHLSAVGKPDSLITFTQNDGIDGWGRIKNVGSERMVFEYCAFEFGEGVMGEPLLQNCLFRSLGVPPRIGCGEVVGLVPE